MATITIEFDTVDKSLKVSKDGKVIKDVQHVSFWQFNDEGAEMSIESVKRNEDEGTAIITRIVASEGQEVKVTEEVKGEDENLVENLSHALSLSR